MRYTVRPATADDAEAISAVIILALRESNARDYTPAIIEQVQLSFSPEAVRGLIAERQVLVATCGEQLLGTASLDGKVVRTVFVAPEVQGQGIGRLLMGRIEQLAREAGVDVLSVPSSLTAEAFYARLGFSVLRENFHGAERTLIMARSL